LSRAPSTECPVIQWSVRRLPGGLNLRLLRTDIIITLCRLTDPIGKGDRQNLTIDRLLADVKSLAPDWLNDRLQQMHT
jgi:hypothetical protein